MLKKLYMCISWCAN